MYIAVSAQRLGNKTRLSLVSVSASVARVVDDYLRDDRWAKAAQVSAEQAQAGHPRVVKRLGKALEAYDHDYKILELHGYKHPVDHTMTDFFAGKKPADVTHAVVVVGRMAIDVCRLRMGSSYPLPMSYPVQDAMRHWNSYTDRTRLLKMTTAELQYRIQLLKSGALKLLGDPDDEDTNFNNHPGAFA